MSRLVTADLPVPVEEEELVAQVAKWVARVQDEVAMLPSPWVPPEQRQRVPVQRVNGFWTRPSQTMYGSRVAPVAPGVPRDVRSARLHELSCGGPTYSHQR